MSAITYSHTFAHAYTNRGMHVICFGINGTRTQSTWPINFSHISCPNTYVLFHLLCANCFVFPVRRLIGTTDGNNSTRTVRMMTGVVTSGIRTTAIMINYRKEFLNYIHKNNNSRNVHLINYITFGTDFNSKNLVTEQIERITI